MAKRLLWIACCLIACAAAEDCVLDTYSSVTCLPTGDYGQSMPPNMCTFCNIYINEKGNFFFRQDPEATSLFRKRTYQWKPATVFGYYELIIAPMSKDDEESLTIARVVENTTLFVVPKLKGNYCHAMNDVIAPLFWRIRQHQQSQDIDTSSVQFYAQYGKPSGKRNLFGFYKYFSPHPVLYPGTLPKAGFVHVREAVVGALGMTIHMNQNYYWHGSRYLQKPVYGMNSIYQNIRLLRQHFFRVLEVPDLERTAVLPDDYIVIANRRNNSRGRSMLNAEEMLTQVQAVLGSAHKVFPKVVYFEDFKLPELAKILSRTKVLLAPHGAGLSNLVLMRSGGAVVELIPFMCHRLRIMLSPLAEALSLHYTFWQPTDNLTPGLSAKVKRSMMRAATGKNEPCGKGLSRTSFNGDAGQLIDRILISLEHVKYDLSSPESGKFGQAAAVDQSILEAIAKMSANAKGVNAEETGEEGAPLDGEEAGPADEAEAEEGTEIDGQAQAEGEEGQTEGTQAGEAAEGE